MEDKKELLGKLKLDAGQREAAPQNMVKWITLGAGSLALALGAWFLLSPEAEPVAAPTAVAAPVAVNPAASNNQSAAVLDATGYVTARRQATVSSKITGKVLEVLVEEGDRVEEGDLLARLDDSSQQAAFNLAQAQHESAKAKLAEVEVQLQEAELAYGRIMHLQEKSLASQADIDSAKLAVDGQKARLAGLQKDLEVAVQSVKVQQQLLDDMQIKAPFAGVVIAKAAQPGEMISPMSSGGFTRTGICTLVDMDSLEIEVDVNESYINRVQPGQPVAAMLNSYPDWRIPAEVITIIPTADRSKATVKVRIRFLAKDPRILPDMGARVAFLEQEPTDDKGANQGDDQEPTNDRELD